MISTLVKFDGTNDFATGIGWSSQIGLGQVELGEVQ